MGMGHEWKEAAVKVLEDFKHRPSKEIRHKAELLLEQSVAKLAEGEFEDRRAAELRKAISRYDRNAGRR